MRSSPFGLVICFNTRSVIAYFLEMSSLGYALPSHINWGMSTVPRKRKSWLERLVMSGSSREGARSGRAMKTVSRQCRTWAYVSSRHLLWVSLPLGNRISCSSRMPIHPRLDLRS